jgi:hypothetical protein
MLSTCTALRDGVLLHRREHRGGAVQVELCLTHSLKASSFKPVPLNVNPGFKMCLSNAACATYSARADIAIDDTGGAPVQVENPVVDP